MVSSLTAEMPGDYCLLIKTSVDGTNRAKGSAAAMLTGASLQPGRRDVI